MITVAVQQLDQALVAAHVLLCVMCYLLDMVYKSNHKIAPISIRTLLTQKLHC
jgi:hypothetical protein